ncbi:MAG: SWIM zinc finger family protein [Methylobacterium sp.]|nr:SWIM zinc finger family protein [Methylobacterium sp.]
MERLHFIVTGSEGNKYQVTFEGEGESLASFCTCPAFKRGGLFCKHAAQMLMGEVSRLDFEMTSKLAQDASSALSLLQTRSTSTRIMAMALAHVPSTVPKRLKVQSAEEAWKILDELARTKGLFPSRIHPSSDDPNEDGLEFFIAGKHGKLKKYPVARICYSEVRYDELNSIDENGNLVFLRVPVQRTMKWTTQIEGRFKSFGTIERAAAELHDWLSSR